MKHILLEILENDTSHNKSATRYLYKNHPELWQDILEATSFLPDDAKAKQRVWHITTDVYERPTCPITGEYVKWYENRYLEAISKAASQQLKWQNGDYDHVHTAELNEKRAASNRGKTVASGQRKVHIISEETKAIRKVKTLATLHAKYGVSNPNDIPGVKEKISAKWIERGATPKHLRTKRRLYYDEVWMHTEKSWKEHFDDINPERINRSNNALDHIYSVQQGFRDNIPPEVIGHYTNLRILSLSENSKKGMRCDKTKEQLFEDYQSY